MLFYFLDIFYSVTGHCVYCNPLLASWMTGYMPIRVYNTPFFIKWDDFSLVYYLEEILRSQTNNGLHNDHVLIVSFPAAHAAIIFTVRGLTLQTLRYCHKTLAWPWLRHCGR